MTHLSGYFKTSHAAELALVETRPQRTALLLLGLGLLLLPWLATPFLLDLATQVALAIVGSVALMLLTGYAGQISLGHAGLIAVGAFTVGILFKETGAGPWITIPAAAALGGLLGLLFGLPSLRLKGLYLAISTLALHFLVVFLGGEYETKRSLSAGIVIDPIIDSTIGWYYALLAVDIAVVAFSLNLLRSRTGRAWSAIRTREVVAATMGIPVARYKLFAFVLSSMMTALAGALFAYYRGFVSVEAFSLFLTIQYVAMIIIGGMGSILGAILGAAFVVLLPFGVESLLRSLPGAAGLAGEIAAINYAAFGLIMILFLLFEPHGLVGIWQRARNYFLLWPFRHRPRGGGTP